MAANPDAVARKIQATVSNTQRGKGGLRMKIVDLLDLPANVSLTCSICIIGSGPAGLTIATELANTHHDVLVIESGPRTRPEPFSSSLNEIESVGEKRVLNQSSLRNRVLGGSSHTWSGRCANLDAIDFEARDWVPYSGWPIGQGDLAPHMERAMAYLGLSSDRDEVAVLEERLLAHRLELHRRNELAPISWDFSQTSRLRLDYVRFGPRFAHLSARNVSVITEATVTNLIPDEQRRYIESVEIAARTGLLYHVKADYVILCGGGIENPRMMLASRSVDPGGVGNARGLVGRFLMDHPRTTLGTFDPQDIPTIQQSLGLRRLPSGSRIQCGFTLPASVQRSQRLLNCAAWTTQHIAEDDVWRRMRSARSLHGQERWDAMRAVAMNLDQLAASLWGKFVLGRPLRRRLSRLDLDVMVEQTPNRDSCIRLSERTDALGVPLAEIDWKIGAMERVTAIRLGQAIERALREAGMPTPRMAPWVSRIRPEEVVFADAAHPAGGTRMASSPSRGVVDEDCKVFGLDNLYVAGSSVFPTLGHANPTLTIVALAVRLAATLRALPHRGACRVSIPTPSQNLAASVLQRLTS